LNQKVKDKYDKYGTKWVINIFWHFVDKDDNIQTSRSVVFIRPRDKDGLQLGLHDAFAGRILGRNEDFVSRKGNHSIPLEMVIVPLKMVISH
jgi:hypothetical protein